ncbi:MAG: hypothetical protein H0T44_02000 [Gemmatimonadales bacterium]|nr:hypothetical protein [Gemmatimonadales bacterium]
MSTTMASGLSAAMGAAALPTDLQTGGMRSVAFLSRMTRAAMQEVLQSDFIRTARAKGCS